METKRYISRKHLGEQRYQDFDKFTYAELGGFLNSSFFSTYLGIWEVGR